MKRGLVLTLTLLIILSVYTVSAEILITKQPREVYSLGDVITVPSTVKTATDITGTFSMDLLCGGHTINFYKNGVSLKSGEEKKFESSLVLSKDIIGNLKGNCKIKASLGNDYLLTNEFEVSDLITINLAFEKTLFSPEEDIILEGSAVKENGQDVDGYIKLIISEGNNSDIEQTETIDNGFFEINVTLPDDMKAGDFLLKVEAYETNALEEKTNIGFKSQSIYVKQIPTSLEIVFEEQEVNPDTSVKVKTILRDQTGEKILNETGYITIKNGNDKILEQREVNIDEFIEYLIKYNEPPAEWEVVSASNKLTSKSKFTISEKESVSVNIINRTVIVKNNGNVPYNQTVLVKIGNESINIPVHLKIDEEAKYSLTAPDGEYFVEVILGNETISDSVLLTGNVISVKEASNVAVSLIRYPLVWIFLIALLGFVSFIVFKRTQRQSFFGYVSSKFPRHRKNFQNNEGYSVSKNSLVKSRNPAYISLSIKGDKQPVSMISLHVKNLSKIQSKEGSIEETLQKIVSVCESEKASTYETGNHLFFILAPAKTKTFGNEKSVFKLSREIKSILNDHNRRFKDRIEFGISLTSGSIVAKLETEEKSGKTILRFMSLGKLMGDSKRLSSHSDGEILIDEKTNSKLKEHIKTESHHREGIKYYTIKDVKNFEENRKFLDSFLHRLETGDKKDSDEERPVEKE